jgi:hypothetical protein
MAEVELAVGKETVGSETMAVDKITLEPVATSLIIGDDYRKDNKIEFKIRLEGNGAVWLRLQIPVGESGVVRRPADANDITVTIPGLQVESKDAEPPPQEVNPSNTKQYRTGKVQVDGKTELVVSIGNVLCRADTRDSEIRVNWSAGAAWTSLSQSVKKNKPTQAKDPILYFIAEPTFLLDKGTVTFTWDLVDGTPEDDAELETPGGNHIKCSGVRSKRDECSRSGAYTLRLNGGQKQVSVNVQTKGWYAIEALANAVIRPDELKQPSKADEIKKWNVAPSVIFQSGPSDDFLYAILVRGKENTARSAVLCKSADGITGWEIVTDSVPVRIASSPGVRLGNRLWLIGGSAVDPEQQSSEISYYDLDQPSGWNKASVALADPNLKFEERMGHACVIAADKTIWVMGGLGRVSCLDDVWQFTLDEKDRSKLIASRLLEHSRWASRYMFSATKFSDMIWVFGGVDLYDNPMGDIWASKSPLEWNQLVAPKDENNMVNTVVGNAIGTGADASGDTVFTVVRTRTRGKNMWNLGRGMSRLSKIAQLEDKLDTSWDTTLDAPDFSALGGDTDTPHSITMTSFKKRLYLRLLHRNALYGEATGAPLFVYVP